MPPARRVPAGPLTASAADALTRLLDGVPRPQPRPGGGMAQPLGGPPVPGPGPARTPIWAELTAAGGDPVAYSWKRVWMTEGGEWRDALPEFSGTLNAYPAGSAAGAAVGQVVRLWPSPTTPNAWEFDPAGAGWVPYRVTGDDGGDPRLYSWELVRLVEDAGSGSPGWVALDPPVTGAANAHRMPSEDYDPPPIPAGQVVLGRPSPTFPGTHELTAWGGQFRYAWKKFVGSYCDNGDIVNVYERRRTYARDLCSGPGSSGDADEL